MWLQVERGILEKEMSDLGLDMTDKDDVSIMHTLRFYCKSFDITLHFWFLSSVCRVTMLRDLALWYGKERGKCQPHQHHAPAVRVPQDLQGTSRESEMSRYHWQFSAMKWFRNNIFNQISERSLVIQSLFIRLCLIFSPDAEKGEDHDEELTEGYEQTGQERRIWPTCFWSQA